MASAFHGLLKPEYLLQPRRLVRRLFEGSRPILEAADVDLELPWGFSIRGRNTDAICRTIGRLGVYELPVTEAIWRLLEPGDTFVDVGANIGYMTAAAIARLGTKGRVVAFEPHPELHRALLYNIGRATRLYPLYVESHAEALSDTHGRVWLSFPEGFGTNSGLGRISADGGTSGVEVPAVRLDDYSGKFGPAITVLKLDVEGHEASVLRGASKLLEHRLIANVIFEEHAGYPSESSRTLETAGCTVFALGRGLFGPDLSDPRRSVRSSWEPPSYLATCTPERVRRVFVSRGWRCLRT